MDGILGHMKTLLDSTFTKPLTVDEIQNFLLIFRQPLELKPEAVQNELILNVANCIGHLIDKNIFAVEILRGKHVVRKIAVFCRALVQIFLAAFVFVECFIITLGHFHQYAVQGYESPACIALFLLIELSISDLHIHSIF